MRHRTIHILLALVVALAPLTATSAEEPHCAMVEIGMDMEMAPDASMDCCDDQPTDACGEEECDGQCGTAGTSSPMSLVLLPGSDWVSYRSQHLLQTSAGVPPGFSLDELRPPNA